MPSIEVLANPWAPVVQVSLLDLTSQYQAGQEVRTSRL